MHIRSPAPAALALLLALPLWLVACHEATSPQNSAVAGNSDNAAMNEEEEDDNTLSAPDAVDPDTMPDSPGRLTAEERKGELGARAVLSDWAHALEHRNWADAHAQWGHDGADSGLDPAAFAKAYEKYASITVTIGNGDVEGAAGSLYYEVPVTIGGTLRNGRPFSLSGPVTLRRVNDVDGASAQQLAWHISQSDLKPRP